MKIIQIVLLCFTGCFSFSCQTNHGYEVYSSNTLDGLTLYIHQDHFIFRYSNGSMTDSTLGLVKKLNDALFLTYKQNSDYSGKDKGTTGELISIGATFSGQHFMMRPHKLLIKGSRLLYLHPKTNEPLSTERGNNKKEIFLQRI